MRILITLGIVAALMVGLVVGIVLAASMLTRNAKAEGQGAEMSSGTVSMVAFAVLWCLVAGAATGVIGGD